MTEAVRAYLAEHPAAMDTLEGIAGWWLMRERVRTDLERLERVLGRMVDSGILEALGSAESPSYHLRRTDLGSPRANPGSPRAPRS